MTLARVLALVLALAPGPVLAQSYYNNGTATNLGDLFTTTNGGYVRPIPGSIFGIAGTVAITGTVPISVTGTLPVSIGAAVSLATGTTVTATAPTASPTDCSATIGVTASQVIAAATARKALMIQNVGTGTIGFKFTGVTPVIAALGTFTLAAGASWASPPGLTQSAAVWAIGSAAGQILSCTYFN